MRVIIDFAGIPTAKEFELALIAIAKRARHTDNTIKDYTKHVSGTYRYGLDITIEDNSKAGR